MGVAKVPPPRPSKVEPDYASQTISPHYRPPETGVRHFTRARVFISSVISDECASSCLDRPRLPTVLARVLNPCSPASSPSIAGVHAYTPPRWEWRRCLPTTISAVDASPHRSVVGVRTGCRPQDVKDGSGEGALPTIYTRARLRTPKSPRPTHLRPPETGVRDSMSPPGC